MIKAFLGVCKGVIEEKYFVNNVLLTNECLNLMKFSLSDNERRKFDDAFLNAEYTCADLIDVCSERAYFGPDLKVQTKVEFEEAKYWRNVVRVSKD